MYARMSALCLAFALMIPGLARAQVSTTGIIEVVVEDAQGGRLPGVTVTAKAADTVTTRTAVTDAQGTARLEALAPSAQYTVTAALSGFRDLTRENIRVSSGQITTLNEQMSLGQLTEQVTVVGSASPVVDVKRAMAGQDITLQLTESLPTGRSYQSYLQLVPGVLPDSPNSTGNPSSRSGVNWKDAVTTDNMGISTDNAYYFDGINVTDPVTGTFGANLNTEIIQEQKVVTGAIPAEYVGVPGLISTVVTKAGSNTYSGSYNFFYRNDQFVAANEHNPGAAFSTKDTAFTIGGPVLRNKIWAFGSYRYVGRTDDVNAQDTHEFLRTVTTTNHQNFYKGTWAATTNHLVSFTFLNDPSTRDGQTDGSIAASRQARREQGGNNYSGTYNGVFGKIFIDGGVNFHDAQISDYAIDRTTRNTIAFRSTDTRTLADEQVGGFGSDLPETRPTKQAKASAQYQWGAHRFKGGLEFKQDEDHRDLIYTGGDLAQYTSLSKRYAGTGVGAADIAGGSWSTRTFRSDVASDRNGLIATFNSSPNRARYYELFDTDGNGTITAAELGAALVFNSTAGNPSGDINYYRIWESSLGEQNTKVRGYSFFGQDEFTLNRWTFNVGLRTERWMHYDTTDKNIYSFDWTWAPRLSAVYDLLGDGRQKVSAYYGRYYDPIRMDMTNFAGSPTGYVRQEQVFIDGSWVTYRTRGPADGLFTPNTKTPYTDEIQFQHEIDLGHNISVSSTYWQRWARDIFEDFDLSVYANAATCACDPNAADALFLGADYFGFDATNIPTSNFYLGTLEGGKRDAKGLEFVARKRFSDNWQMLTSYNWLDQKSNAVSDGVADFAGDVIWLDPRAPNMYGTMPGTIHHIFKAAGSYTLPFGLELGGTYRWNSGTIVNKTQLSQSRRLPVEVDVPFEFGGYTDRWVAPDAIGAVQNPSWGNVDARIQYVRKFNPVTAEFFVDIFNVFNDQAVIRLEDATAGTGTTKFLDPIQWAAPRNAFIGARVRF